MLSLPFPPHRSHLTGFWLILHGLGLVLVGLVSLVERSGSLGPVLAALLVASIASGLASRDLRLFGYRAWNRAARLLGALAQWWVLRVVHLLLLGPIRLAGSKLPVARQGVTMWESYPEQLGQTVEEVHTPSGMSSACRHLLRQATGPNRRRWLALAPFLTLLSYLAVEKNQEFDVPTQRYTLY